MESFFFSETFYLEAQLMFFLKNKLKNWKKSKGKLIKKEEKKDKQ